MVNSQFNYALTKERLDAVTRWHRMIRPKSPMYTSLPGVRGYALAQDDNYFAVECLPLWCTRCTEFIDEPIINSGDLYFELVNWYIYCQKIRELSEARRHE